MVPIATAASMELRPNSVMTASILPHCGFAVAKVSDLLVMPLRVGRVRNKAGDISDKRSWFLKPGII